MDSMAKIRFACDAMLGGLARWLRAAGYEASWHDGELAVVAKEEAADRAPPRSLAGHDRFWECVRCGKVFWHGTHWKGVAERLRQAASGGG